MTTNQKRKIIKKYVSEMLEQSKEEMIKKIDKVLNSGAIDVDLWSDEHNKMILPKSIVIALMEDEATQYRATGTVFEKEVNDNVRNLKYFI